MRAVKTCEKLTLRDQRVHRSERGVLGVVRVGAVDHVLEQEQVPRAPLDDRQEPVPEPELSAAGIGFLLGDEVRESDVRA